MSRENQVQTFRFPLAMEFHGDMLNSPSNDGGQHVQSTVHRGAHPSLALKGFSMWHLHDALQLLSLRPTKTLLAGTKFQGSEVLSQGPVKGQSPTTQDIL